MMVRKQWILTFYLVLVALGLSACKVEVITSQGGRVVDVQGNVFCADGQRCELDITDTLFIKKLFAEPSPGYRFTGWRTDERFLCAGQLSRCELNTTGFAAFPLLMSFLENDEVFYLEPIFELIPIHEIRGQLRLSSAVLIDSDMPSLGDKPISNSRMGNAQIMAVPGLVVGHIINNSDNADFYRVTLKVGQKIQFNATAEGRCALLELNGDVVTDISEDGYSIGRSGDYLIRVTSESVTTNYSLIIMPDESNSFTTVLPDWPQSLKVGGAGEALTVSDVSASAQWLDVSAKLTNINGAGQYALRLKDSLGDGIYETAVSIRSNEGVSTVPVRAYVARENAHNRPSITLYARLFGQNDLNPWPYELFPNAVIGLESGDTSSDFTLHHRRQDRYRLFIGTDLDGDGELCDVGELCGVYQPNPTEDSFLLDRNLDNTRIYLKPVMK